MTDSGEAGIFAGQYELVFTAYLGPFSLVTYEVRKTQENKPSHSMNAQSNEAVPGMILCNNCAYDVDPINVKTRTYIFHNFL